MNNISGLSPIVFNPPRTASTAADDFIASCKGKEMLLEANSRQSTKQAADYLTFLLDLNRFEEAYQKAQVLFASEEAVLAGYAAFLDDPQIISKHVKNFSLASDASDLEWIALIFYHDVSGTIDQLAYSGQPLPNNRYLKALIYFLAKDYYAVYSLLVKDSPHVEENELWYAWMACQKLEFKEKENDLLNVILSVRPDLPKAYFLSDVCDALLKSVTESTHNAIKIYLQEQLNKYPYCFRLINFFSTLCEEPMSSQYAARLKKAYATYPTMLNKMCLILTGSIDEKHKILLSFYRSNPIIKSAFYQLYKFYDRDPQIRRELLEIALSKSTHICYKIEEITLGLEQREPADLLLQKIEPLLNANPFNRKLLYQKITALLILKRDNDAFLAIKKYLSIFGVTSEICSFIYSYTLHFNDVDYVISVLRKGHQKFRKPNIFGLIKNLYREHKPTLEYIRFIIEEAIPQEVAENSDFDPIESKLAQMEDKSEAHALIDSISRNVAYIKFIAWRASYYSEIEPHKALTDIDYTIKYRPNDAANKLRLRILVNLDREVEAANIYLSSKLELSGDLIELMIRNLFVQNQCELVASIYKRNKAELSYETLSLVGWAYKLTNKFTEGLGVYKRLISLNPKEAENYLSRAMCFESLGQFGSAIDVLNDGIAVLPDNDYIKKCKDELIARANNKGEAIREDKAIPTKQSAKRTDIDPKKVTYIIQESTKKDSKREAIEKPKEDKGKKALQKANPHAVDPLKDPLAEIKAIARRGETQTGPKQSAVPAPAPIAAAPRTEAPKPIVKVNLRAEEKVFIQKGLVALKDVLDMKEALLTQEIVFRNYIYAILRVFTPLRINTTHASLQNDLKRIRDHARHESDLVVIERLTPLFTYLRSISLAHQMQEWIREKSVITRLMLNNHYITVRKPKRTPLEKVVKELEFIIKEKGEKSSWEARLYHRNAIKASLSIIGEASNFLSDEMKALFADYRQAGNKIAHDFFEDGDTLAFIEKYKEEDISPDALWELVSIAENLLKKIREIGK